MNRNGTPIVFNDSGATCALSQIDLQNRSIKEGHLQNWLDKCPEILPVDEIDPSFAPLASLGREIIAIDNLFISPNGKLTLVETKLWRNPEATRKVVAQILEYATTLSNLSYSEFEAEIRRTSGLSPYELASKRFPQQVLPERHFIDELQKNLRDARFLLMIVGDGIKEELKGLLERLHQQNPQMLYTFSLVELSIYENHELFGNGQLIISNVVAKSTEFVRAVVQVQTSGDASVSIAIEEQSDETSSNSSKRQKLSENIFFDELKDTQTKALFQQLIKFAAEIDAQISWGTSGPSIKISDPGGSSQKLTLFLLNTSGEVYIGWLSDQLERVSLDKNISYEFARKLADMFSDISPKENNPEALSRSIKASELFEKSEDFMELVRQTVNKINGLQ